jgi:hypothetical protein
MLGSLASIYGAAFRGEGPGVVGNFALVVIVGCGLIRVLRLNDCLDPPPIDHLVRDPPAARLRIGDAGNPHGNVPWVARNGFSQSGGRHGGCCHRAAWTSPS